MEVSMQKRTRVSYEQREKMLEYMVAHPDFSKNQLTGVEATRMKAKHLSELATLLNSCLTGATKSPEKWIKCWQDWRSDVKAKAAKIQRSLQTTGVAGPAPLSALEESLLTFIDAADGVTVADPLDVLETDEYEIEQTEDSPRKLKREKSVIDHDGETDDNNPADNIKQKRTRVSYEQREKMFEYMVANLEFARNQLSGDLSRKAKHQAELTHLLNNCTNGPSKSPEKWMKCWQDWRSDVKAKAARVQLALQQPGIPLAAPLTSLEESLIAFIEAPDGVNVSDPLDVLETEEYEIEYENSKSNSDSKFFGADSPPRPTKRKKSAIDHDGETDDNQIFGDFVASELRSLKSNESRKKLKRMIQRAILEVGDLDDAVSDG